jgi:hypothetical protein
MIVDFVLYLPAFARIAMTVKALQELRLRYTRCMSMENGRKMTKWSVTARFWHLVLLLACLAFQRSSLHMYITRN